MPNPKFIMLVGLPASGKSTFAKKLASQESALLLSSDDMREELFHDVNHREDNGLLFNELYKRAREALKRGQSVIVDATNIASKKRIGALQQFGKYEKDCYYFATPYEVCLQRNQQRDRIVPLEALDKMYKSMHIPAYYEGWDHIHFIHATEPGHAYAASPWDPFQPDLIASHDAIFKALTDFHPYFTWIHNLPQDTPYHTFSVSRHTYHVMEYLLDNNTYSGEDRLQLLWSALLHDIGKSVCKNFKPGRRYANFMYHENVSAQMAVEVLHQAGYDDPFLLNVANLVQLHMYLLRNREQEGALQKLEQLTGKDLFDKLALFREADTSAK